MRREPADLSWIRPKTRVIMPSGRIAYIVSVGNDLVRFKYDGVDHYPSGGFGGGLTMMIGNVKRFVLPIEDDTNEI